MMLAIRSGVIGVQLLVVRGIGGKDSGSHTGTHTGTHRHTLQVTQYGSRVQTVQGT